MNKKQNTQSKMEITDQSIETYFSSIAHYQTITAEEEAELARRIHQGDKEALNRLVCANLRFVISIAKLYQNRGMDLDDLIEEGNIGLCRAAERFDETLGFKFISFAVKFVRQAITDALSEHSRLVRLPHGQIKILNKIREIHRKYQQLYNRKADVDEIAAELEMTPSAVKVLLAADEGCVSFDATLCEESDSTLLDVYDTESETYTDSALNVESNAMEFDRILRTTLKERDLYVIRHTFGIGCEELSQLEIAANLGLSRESIRLIRDRAIGKLREHNICQKLRLCC